MAGNAIIHGWPGPGTLTRHELETSVYDVFNLSA